MLMNNNNNSDYVWLNKIQVNELINVKRQLFLFFVNL